MFSDTPKLRPRDHRLLATWSYFFSSNLSRFHLPWSQFVHVSLLDPSAKNFRALPDCLKHSIVALCINDRFDQVNIHLTFPSSYQLHFSVEILLDASMESFIIPILRMKFWNV